MKKDKQMILEEEWLTKSFSPVFQITAGVGGIKIDGQQEDEFPPPPPELLQQQYLYGAAPQQGVYTQKAAPRGAGVQTFRPGTGQTDMPKAQQASMTVIPVSSTPIQVEKR